MPGLRYAAAAHFLHLMIAGCFHAHTLSAALTLLPPFFAIVDYAAAAMTPDFLVAFRRRAAAMLIAGDMLARLRCRYAITLAITIFAVTFAAASHAADAALCRC